MLQTQNGIGEKKRKNLLIEWIEQNKGDKSLLQGFPLSHRANS